jgi:hypothetical protein
MRAAVLGLLLLVTYGWFHHQGGFSQNTRFDMTRAIVEQGTLRIDAYHGNTGDKAVRDGHYYCDKPPLPSLLAVPPYFAFVRTLRALGRDPTTPRAQTVGFWLARMAAVSLFGCALAVVFLRVVERHAGSGLAAALGLGLGTLVFPYSTVLYGHVVAAALLFGAFAVLLAVRRGDGAGPAALVAAGVAAGGAVASEYQVVLVVGLPGSTRSPRPARSTPPRGSPPASRCRSRRSWRTTRSSSAGRSPPASPTRPFPTGRRSTAAGSTA